MNSKVMGFMASIGVNLAESSIPPIFYILDYIEWGGDYGRVSGIEMRIANAENEFCLTYSQSDKAYYEGKKAGNYVIAGIGIYMEVKGLAGIAGGNIALSAVGGILGGNGNSGFVRPESAVTGSKKHGENWKEGSARAKSTGNPQGQWAQSDLDYATEIANTLKPGESGYFDLPEGSQSIVHMPDRDIARVSYALDNEVMS